MNREADLAWLAGYLRVREASQLHGLGEQDVTQVLLTLPNETNSSLEMSSCWFKSLIYLNHR